MAERKKREKEEKEAILKEENAKMKARLKAATGKDDKSHPKAHHAGDRAEVANAVHAHEAGATATATTEPTHPPLCFSTTTPFREWSSALVAERGAEVALHGKAIPSATATAGHVLCSWAWQYMRAALSRIRAPLPALLSARA